MTLNDAFDAELSDRVRVRAMQAIREKRVEAVSVDEDRVTYRVRSGDAEYLIGLPTDEDREAPVRCDCKAGESGRLCNHLVAAIALHYEVLRDIEEPVTAQEPAG